VTSGSGPARWGLVLVGLVAAVLVAALFLPREHPVPASRSITVLIANVSAQADATTQVYDVARTAQAKHADVVYLLIPVVAGSGPDQKAQLQQQNTDLTLLAAVRGLTNPAQISLVAGGSQDQIVKALPGSARILDGTGKELRHRAKAGEKRYPGRQDTALWALALLVAGGVLMLIAKPPRARGPAQDSGTASALPAGPVTGPIAPPTRTPRGPAGRSAPTASTALATPPAPAGTYAPASAGTATEWWSGGASASATARRPAASPSMTPEPSLPESGPKPVLGRLDLARFARGATVTESAPQCPACGAFAVQRIRPGTPALTEYQCLHCGSTWALRPNEAWPAVVVRPRRHP
jgi:hypothetical protein